MSKGSYMCHGHCHSTTQTRKGKIIDFAVEAHNWTPWPFEEVVEYMNKSTIKHEGHH